MIFADKLILLRKKSGWSQEELAEQMNVTRQSISKWECTQAVPDIEKMTQLSELFEVSTDYLLKDDIEDAENLNSSKDISSLKRVSMEDATAFLSAKAITSKSIALAVFLCILSPICLFILGIISETSKYGLSNNVAGGIGMIILLILVAIAVAIFISSSSKTAPFAYLEKEVFKTECGVSEMVKERKEQYKRTYMKNNIIGVCLCIISLIPLFAGAIFDEENELLLTIMSSLFFVLVGIGVVLFIRTGIIWASYQKLLQEGDYSKAKKAKQSITTAISITYWLIATAIFLAYSLITNDLGYSWIVWVVAGVLFPAVIMISNVLIQRK